MPTDYRNWHKSMASGDGGDNSVEVAITAEAVYLRDTKDAFGPVLIFTIDEWRAFVVGIKNGEFDLTARESGSRPSKNP